MWYRLGREPASAAIDAPDTPAIVVAGYKISPSSEGSAHGVVPGVEPAPALLEGHAGLETTGLPPGRRDLVRISPDARCQARQERRADGGGLGTGGAHHGDVDEVSLKLEQGVHDAGAAVNARS